MQGEWTLVVVISIFLLATRTPVPASHGIFIISAPLLYSNHRIHVLKLSEIISKDGEYIGDFKFSRDLPSGRHSYLYLTCSARVYICPFRVGAMKRFLKASCLQNVHQNHYLYLTLLKKSNGHCTINRLQIYLKLWH